MVHKVVLNIFIIIFLVSCSYSVRDNNYMLKDWKVSFGDSTEWVSTEKKSFDLNEINSKTIFLKATIPETEISDPVLFIGNSYQSMEVFLDDSLIYSFGSTEKNDLRISRYWHIIDLPENCALSQLLFKITSPVHLIGLSDHIFIDSYADIYRKMTMNDLPKIFIGLFLIFFGIAAVVLTIYLKQFKNYAGLNSFITLFGLWLLFNPQTTQLYVNNPCILYYTDLPLLIMSAASFIFFFAGFFIRPVKNILIILSYIHFAAGAVLTISDLAGLITIKQFGSSYLIFLLSSNIFIVIMIFLRTIEKKSEARIIMTGAVVFLILASVEIVSFFNGINMSAFGLDLSFVHIGAMLLVIFWIILYFLRYVRMNRIYMKSQEDFSRSLLDFQNEERKRIASELHDAAGHDFLVIKTLSQMGCNEPGKVNIPDILKNISETSENAVNNLRNICRALYPPLIENLGLRKSLISLVEKSFANTEIQSEIDIEYIDSYFKRSDHIHIYRIVQELITNILKHSGADHVALSIRDNSGYMILTLTDNGKGIPESVMYSVTTYSKGMGLKGISERAGILGGKMSLENIRPSGLKTEIKFTKSDQESKNENTGS